MIYIEDNTLIREYDGEIVAITPFGRNSLRVRVTKRNSFIGEDWALIPQDASPCEIHINAKEDYNEAIRVNASEKVLDTSAYIINGKIKALIAENGKLSFKRTDDGSILLQEFEIERKSILGINSRELKRISGDSYKASLKFHSNRNEKIYGMGQYQNGIFNLKGSVLELAQRNSQASVPFMYSSLGYGFLWNNPAIGKVTFGKNITEWEAYSTKQIDFWITCEDTPSKILEAYMNVTGKPPMMPEYGLGFWQSKLRYYNQDQVLNVVKGYKIRGVPLDVIIIDFFHWPLEGDWCFDSNYWPDPGQMVREIQQMGTKVMVSVWPTVSVHSKNYKEMKERGYLIRSENGVKINMLMIDPTSFVDVTNPNARNYFWNKIKDNYYRYGLKDFWLDVAEPEYSSYDFENYTYYKGSALEVGNEYPALYTKTFYEGLKSQGEEEIVNLVRCAWAGSQKYGALVWSGDIPSTFSSLKMQIVCGLQMAMAGIPWWTTDIGGFLDGNINDEKFKELLVRWFQYGTFCPVMRLHGNRLPSSSGFSDTGGGRCGTGADNEIWSFGQENYQILKKYINIREKLRPYIRNAMQICSETGAPIIRPLFYDYPGDPELWEIEDQYMFGKDILVAPVTEYLGRERNVYLPKGNEWIHAFSGKSFDGGQEIVCQAPIDEIPFFIRSDNTDVLISLFSQL